MALHRATDYYGIIGCTNVMRQLYRRIERFAHVQIPLLIEGETGTGKEMVAQAIRCVSGCERRFAAVNCAAIPKHLLESELFGHEQGAFTGATRRHPGILAQVDGGILFLDEISELPPSAQAKLLRVLESGEFRPVGSEHARRASFRLITATNQSLAALVRRRHFRLDLLHRLGAARIAVPSLRDRVDDIPLLSEAFLRRFAQVHGRGHLRLTAEALHLLQTAAWPGNVRELRHVVEAAASLASGDHVTAAQVREFLGLTPAERSLSAPTLAEAIRAAERSAIEGALRLANGNRDRAAELLGISVATLYRRLAAHPQSAAERCDGLPLA